MLRITDPTLKRMLLDQIVARIDAGGIDGINWRNSASFLDDTEREVLARAQRRADRLGMGPTDEALAGIAKCAKLRVLDVSGGNWTATGLAELGACTDLKVLKMEVHQCFGTWSGTVVTDDGETVAFDGILGFAEEARNRW